MTLEQAITIFIAFDTWCRLPELVQPFAEYSKEQVLDAQSLILASAHQYLVLTTQNN